jgi:hypothetical protein
MRSLFVALAGLSLILWPLGARAAEPEVSAEAFAPLPSGIDDLERRIIARFNVDVAPVVTSISSQPNPIGLPETSDTLRAGSTYLEGAAALGTRGMLLPTLNTYFLGTGNFDLAGVPTVTAPINGPPPMGTPRPAAEPSIYDRFPNGRALLLHLGYGEVDGITKDGALAHVKIRAGRQFHYGLTGVTFDGATAGYDDGELEIMGRIGQRSAVFDRTQPHPGIIAGGDARYRHDFGSAASIDAAIEFMHFQRDIVLLDRDQAIMAASLAGATTVHSTDDVGELRANLYLGSELGLWGRLSYVNPDVSHGRVGAEWSSGPLAVLLSFDEKIGRDLTFDLASASGITSAAGRNSTYEIFRLNIPNLQPYSELDATIAYEALDWLEIDFRPGGRWVHGDVASRSAFDANHLLLGGDAYGRFRLDAESGLEAALDYDALFYSRDGTQGDLRTLGGEMQSHTFSASLRYMRGDRFVHGRMIGGQRLSVGVGTFSRLSKFDTTPFNASASSVTESVIGGRADARWSFSKYAATYLAYEYALDSNVFDPQFGGFHLLRAGIEGRF